LNKYFFWAHAALANLSAAPGFHKHSHMLACQATGLPSRSKSSPLLVSWLRAFHCNPLCRIHLNQAPSFATILSHQHYIITQNFICLICEICGSRKSNFFSSAPIRLIRVIRVPFLYSLCNLRNMWRFIIFFIINVHQPPSA